MYVCMHIYIWQWELIWVGGREREWLWLWDPLLQPNLLLPSFKHPLLQSFPEVSWKHSPLCLLLNWNVCSCLSHVLPQVSNSISSCLYYTVMFWFLFTLYVLSFNKMANW